MIPEQAIPTARERVIGGLEVGESFLTLSFSTTPSTFSVSITPATAAGCQR